MRILQILILTLTISIPGAYGLVQGNLHYGQSLVNPEKLNNRLVLEKSKAFYSFGLLGGEVVGDFPAIPIEVGLRYTYGLGLTEPEYGILVGRTSIVVKYWIINMPTLGVGPIVSYGILHMLDMFITTSSKVKQDYDQYSSATSWTAAIGGTAKLNMFRFGGELGYQSWKYTDVSGPQGPLGFDLEFPGIYFLLSAGIGF